MAPRVGQPQPNKFNALECQTAVSAPTDSKGVSAAVANQRLAANGSPAVMAQRREPPTALDFFPTPPWATRALFRHVLPALGVEVIVGAWEPACGEGHMAAVIAEFAGSSVIASD